ncbi:hypothetical protein [Streptomyces sp. NPDC046925]|uniref:hypothetical protein n=1 Tax=Streptomyces sp. NPDC046925 TaxID=3155375 RepID=UPI0033C81884
MSPAGPPPLTSTPDQHATERVPLADRDLALTPYDLLVRAAQRWPDEPCSLWIPDAAAIAGSRVLVTAGPEPDASLWNRGAGEVRKAAAVLHSYDVHIRTEARGAQR